MSVPGWWVLAGIPAAAAVTWAARQTALRRQLVDRPNERSAHVTPTPRLGGIGVMLAFIPLAVAAVLLEGGGARALAVVGATAAISVLGLIDDLRPLRARWRFGVQLVVACGVVAVSWPELAAAWTLLPLPPWLLAPISVLWIVWLTNLYNFMDGIDGLAGGQAVIAGAAIALAARVTGGGLQGTLALAMGAAALGFLVFNFPPASIFMGDVGSTAIGFFFASLPFLPGGKGAVSVEVVGLALALFVLDATTTLVRRLMRGERFYQAHRTHWYQRPLACGVRHRPITLSAYAGMLAVAGLALRYPAASPADRVTLVAGGIAVFAGVVALVLTLERRHAAAAQGQAQPQP
jgi:UDP-N-acetylmuramyl pentapeptide phosphotransferase/UDP-N-acetylglucosamine-1-phosphate transferase